jgi:ATP/maltotriose-dependent transcriptional regulator MalT
MYRMRTARSGQAPTLGKKRHPRLGRSIGRDRLFAAIDRTAAWPGLWIAGPAGFGKSTLVATCLESRGWPSRWLQLDSGDADPAALAHSLRQSAASLAPSTAIEMPRPTADDLRDVPAFIRRCFRRLSLVLDRPWLLVLDNIQELDLAPALHAGIAATLAEMPEGSRLFSVSREPPTAEHARPLAAQQLAGLHAAALHFTTEEAGPLLQLHERAWSAEDLCEATSGWAAAMIPLLAARAESGGQAAVQDAGPPERLFDLFAGEVMDTLAPWQRDALLRIAFLPSATAAQGVSLSGEPRAGDFLEDLARRSLFTDRRGSELPICRAVRHQGRRSGRHDEDRHRLEMVRAVRVSTSLLHSSSAVPPDGRLGR